jgi:hypothetical protein
VNRLNAKKEKDEREYYPLALGRDADNNGALVILPQATPQHQTNKI